MPALPEREAAETLLQSCSPRDMSLSHSVNMIASELAGGYRDSGRMSSVRRFFCLLVTFDLLFTTLMWIICIVLPGGSLAEDLVADVVHYSVRTSAVDIVGVAAARFILLILFYALLHINNTSVVAITTSFSSAMLIAKVLLFNWPTAKEPVYHVLLILTSFVLAWGEPWYLDSRVFPQELQADLILNALCRDRGAATERTPLLRAGTSGAESTTRYYSPIGSPNVSTVERELILPWDREVELRRTAENSIVTAWRLLHAQEWNLEKQGKVRGDVVQSMNTKEYGVVFRFSGTVDCSASWLYNDLRDNHNKMNEWNLTVLESHTIKKLQDGIDLVYQRTSKTFNFVPEREFVLVRISAGLSSSGQPVENSTAPEAFVLSGTSIDLPEFCSPYKLVRGDTKIGAWFLFPKVHRNSSGKVEEKCKFLWLLNCDAKVRVPVFLRNKFFPGVMLDTVGYLRAHVANAKKDLF